MTNEEIFDRCVEIYQLPSDDEKMDKLYPLLQDLKDKNIKEYPFVLNHLIRELGLYPYMSGKEIIFEDRVARECFTEDVGEQEPRTLHREQARILHKLLEGKILQYLHLQALEKASLSMHSSLLKSLKIL